MNTKKKSEIDLKSNSQTANTNKAEPKLKPSTEDEIKDD